MACAARFASTGALVILGAGCPDPNVYATARTTPVGRVSHTIAVQTASYRFDNTKEIDGVRDANTTPLPPTYQLRVGVLDRLDIGLRFTHVSSLGMDVKWNFLETEVLDIAVDPGIHLGVVDACAIDDDSIGQLFSNVPVIFDLNVTDWLSIVPTTGIAYGCGARARLFANSPSLPDHVKGLMLRNGLGLEVRVSPMFGLHPEVTYLSFVGSSSDPGISWVVYGLGFNFGALPQWAGN